MSLLRNTAHVAQAVANLTAQFEQSPRLQALIESYVAEVQQLEDAALDVLAQFNVDTAIGTQLDIIGAYVEEPRFGRNDDDYRLTIRAKIKLITSRGTREDVIGLIRAIIPTATVEIDEYYPASFIARVIGPIDPAEVDPALIARFIEEGAAAGVGAGVVLHVAPPFQYDSGSGFDVGKYADIF